MCADRIKLEKERERMREKVAYSQANKQEKRRGNGWMGTHSMHILLVRALETEKKRSSAGFHLLHLRCRLRLFLYFVWFTKKVAEKFLVSSVLWRM